MPTSAVVLIMVILLALMTIGFISKRTSQISGKAADRLGSYALIIATAVLIALGVFIAGRSVLGN